MQRLLTVTDALLLFRASEPWAHGRSPLCDLTGPRYGMVDPAPARAPRSGWPAQQGHSDSDRRLFDFEAERAGSLDVGHVTSRPRPGRWEGGLACSLSP